MQNILIIEDDSDIQTQMKWGLSKEYNVLQAHDMESALKLFDKYEPKIVTLDLGLPPDENGPTEGFACLREILKKAYGTQVIMVTGNNERENALNAIQIGAYDYFLKPIDMNELKVIIKRAFHLADIESQNRDLHKLLDKEAGFCGMIAQSTEMQNIFSTIHKVASTDATVVITGESGTGKELVARAVHEKSSRKKGPFIPINCGAIPENLLESELFGHEKGAFTNAYSQQHGKLEYADKGTLFLDEIGEMSTMLQAKLLRFLQEKKIQRIGGRTDIEIDTRVIAATNIDLQSAMKENKFREDLFFRLSVISIEIPPLRDREFDVELLAKTFLERNKIMFKSKVTGFSRASMDAIMNYSWPGNVRELENKIQKAVIMAESNIIEPLDLGLDDESGTQASDSRIDRRYQGITLKEARKRLEVDLISTAVKRSKGNIKRASEELGISRPTLYDMIEKYKLSVKDS
jgi:two-component system NtrC family response regulator